MTPPKVRTCVIAPVATAWEDERTFSQVTDVSLTVVLKIYFASNDNHEGSQGHTEAKTKYYLIEICDTRDVFVMGESRYQTDTNRS